MPPLPRAFYDRFVITVARQLLGCCLVRNSSAGRVVGRIVETEAYLCRHDSASHAAPGVKNRNRAMFGPPGHAYVYAIHARWCFNVVTQPHGQGAAVLIRAVEPLVGEHLMAKRRKRERPRELTRGPARLCEAFDIDKRLNHHDLTSDAELWIAGGESLADDAIVATPRVGVTSAEHHLLRFAYADNAFVSR
jgi:DNA-3-methyladenine glycosylase